MNYDVGDLKYISLIKYHLNSLLDRKVHKETETCQQCDWYELCHL